MCSLVCGECVVPVYDSCDEDDRAGEKAVGEPGEGDWFVEEGSGGIVVDEEEWAEADEAGLCDAEGSFWELGVVEEAAEDFSHAGDVGEVDLEGGCEYGEAEEEEDAGDGVQACFDDSGYGDWEM